MTEQKKWPFEVSITYPRNEVLIEIHDAISGVCFLSLKMRAETFAAALANRSNQWAEGHLRLEHVGKTHEVKREVVNVTAIPSGFYGEDFTKALRKIVEPLEVDGWKADLHEKGRNHHRQKTYGGETVYEVTFRRFIETPPELVEHVFREGRHRNDPVGVLLQKLKERLESKDALTAGERKELAKIIDYELKERS